MGCDDRFGRKAHQLLHALVVEVGDVDDDVLPLHLPDCLTAKGGEAHLRVDVAGGQLVGAVPGQGHHLDAVLFELLDVLQLAVQHGAALHRKQSRALFAAGDAADVVGGVCHLDDVGVLLEHLVEIGQHLLIVGNSVHSPLAVGDKDGEGLAPFFNLRQIF